MANGNVPKLLIWLVMAGAVKTLSGCSVSPDESKVIDSDRSLTVRDSTVRNAGDTADATTPDPVNQEAKSFELFQNTVYEVVQNCVSCHGSTTAPRFAAQDPVLAFSELIDSSKVNLQDPASSRLVLRLSDDLHNCWSDCASDSQTMLAAITQWAEALGTGSNAATFPFMSEGLTFAEAVSNATSNPLQKGIVALEVESTTLKAPFVAATEDGVSFVTSTEGGGTATTTEEATDNNELGTITIDFEADETWPAWEVYVRVQALDQNGNTVFFQMNNQPIEQWEITPTGNDFAFRKIALSGSGDRRFQLPKGKHTLKFIQGEDNIKFDKIILTRVTIADLDAVNTTSMKSTVFYYDLSKHVGGLEVGLAITIDDLDASAYLFRDFVLVNNSGKTIAIKGLYPVINNTYKSNHSAWSKARVSTAEAISEFASNSTTVLKDKGVASDSIRLGFDDISVVD